MEKLYDLLVVRTPTDEYTPPNIPFESKMLWKRGLIPLARPRDEVKALKESICIDNKSSPALRLIPLNYRVTHVQLPEARLKAEKRRDELISAGVPLGELEGGFDEDWFWEFSCSHAEWEKAGLIPGRVFICIDKVDGHVYSELELQDAWSNMR